MAGAEGVVAFLTPPGHPGVDQGGIVGLTVLGSDAEPFSHTWTEALQDDIAGLGQSEYRSHAFGFLKVHRDRTSTTV